jgi:hypothetical protein
LVQAMIIAISKPNVEMQSISERQKQP